VSGFKLDNYVDVPTRLRLALDKHPDLRIQELDSRIEETPAGFVLICRISVWRTPDDPLPTIASAAEPLPGRTPYTKDSELMVGFTSALGRALGYMGFGIQAGIASADEVAARRIDGEPSKIVSPGRISTAALSAPSDAQIRMIRALGSSATPTTKQDATRLIDELKAGKSEGEGPW
jgi:hypothetical protein